MLNPFELDFVSWLPVVIFVGLVLCVGGFAVWEHFDGRLSPEEKTAADLGFEHGYLGRDSVEFESSSVELAYLVGYNAGEKRRRLKADREKLDELTRRRP